MKHKKTCLRQAFFVIKMTYFIAEYPIDKPHKSRYNSRRIYMEEVSSK